MSLYKCVITFASAIGFFCLSGLGQMSDQALFGHIDLDYPGLELVKGEVEAGNYSAASAAYVAFLRSRTLPNYPTPVSLPASYPSSNRRPSGNVSEQALANTFTVKNVSHTFNSEVDWFFNPTDPQQNPGYNGPFVLEWTNQFNRLNIFRYMANDFQATGNPIYVTKLNELLAHWIENVPRPAGKAQNSSGLISPWRSLEVGIRTSNNFPETWRQTIQTQELADATIIAWVKSWIQHAEYLVSYPGTRNFLTTESEGLFITGLFFPELKEAGSWRQLGLARLQGQLTEEVYPDGALMELSPGYHGIVANNFANTLDLAVANNIAVDPLFQQTVEAMYDYMLRMMQPDLSLPRLNDTRSDPVKNSVQQYASILFPDREDFQWVITGRQQGQAPTHLSQILPWSGVSIMRENWTSQSNYLLMEYGPIGTSHQHEDKLGIQLAAYGELFVSESGPYLYGNSPLRSYSTSSKSHSVLLIDSYGQYRYPQRANIGSTTTPYPVTWSSGPAFDFVSASYGNRPEELYEGNRNLGVWTRNILYLKPDIFLIIDQVIPNDTQTHLYQSHFHLKADNPQLNSATHQVVISEAGRPAFSITPLLTQDLSAEMITGQMQPEILGWELDRQGRQTPKPTLRYSTNKVGPLHMAYVFKGAPQGSSLNSPTLTALATDSQSFGVELSWTENSQTQRAQVIVALDPLQGFTWEGETYQLPALLIQEGSCPIDLSTGQPVVSCEQVLHTLQIKGKVFLEGFLATDTLTLVREPQAASYIPQSQPFSKAPYHYSGKEEVSSFPPGTIDWVLLELRDPSDYTNLIARRAALLREDGRFMDLTGSVSVKFDSLAYGPYYLSVIHQSHLPVISSTPIEMGPEPIYHNFALPSNVQGIEQIKLIPTLNTYALFAGDFDKNGLIDNLDYNLWKQNASRLNTYLPMDADGNGVINNLDFNLWKKNRSKVGFFLIGN